MRASSWDRIRGAEEDGTDDVKDWRAEAKDARQEEELRLDVVLEEPVSGRADLFS